MLVMKHKSNGSKIASGDRIVRMTEDGRWFLNTGLDKWSEVVAEMETPVVVSEPEPAPVDVSPEPEPVINEYGPAAQPDPDAEVIYMTGNWLDLTGRTDIVIRGYGKRIRLNRCQRVRIEATKHELPLDINFGIEVRDCEDVTVVGCEVSGPINAIGLFGCKRFYVGSNKMDRVGGDAMKVGSSEDGIVERNRGVINIAVLDGAHPDFCQLQGVCRRLKFRYNINLNYGQGLFSGQGPHEDIEAHDNVLLGSHANQIYLIGSGLHIHHNTILFKPGSGGKTAYINVTQSEGAANVIEPNNVQVKNKGARGIGFYGLTLQVEDAAATYHQSQYALGLPQTGPWLDPKQLAVAEPGYGARLDLI